jgi:hypothetical protein
MRRGQQSSWSGLVFVFMICRMLSYNYGGSIDSLAELCQCAPRRKSNKKNCWAAACFHRYVQVFRGLHGFLRLSQALPKVGTGCLKQALCRVEGVVIAEFVVR